MKYTICLTQRCNLSCAYCYIGKRSMEMSPLIGEQVVNFIFANTPPDERINIGYFGGEPLLSFDLLKFITNAVESHPAFTADRVQLAVVTNGTILNDRIVDYLTSHNISFCLSCDGPQQVQDAFRRFPDGRSSSPVVEQTLQQALTAFPVVLVNAVYHPTTFRLLPRTVDYFASLGINQIYLNADYSARWSRQDLESIYAVYGQIGQRYVDHYLRGRPLFISVVDSKIAVILRGGYHAGERCQMGRAEMAFTPDGSIYPCERLIGNRSGEHCIGNVATGVKPLLPLCMIGPRSNANDECRTCGIAEYCMNWCGCSNYFSTQDYNRAGPFLCASERAALQVAFSVFQELEHLVGPAFADHLAGLPFINSVVTA